MMKAYLIIALTCLLTSGVIGADEPDRTAYKLAETRLMAEWVGDADEQYNLATAYYRGELVPRDFKEAFNWFSKAADQGHVISQYKLGVMYDNGEGVPRNDVEAFKWYQKAAEQGNAFAQLHVGKKFAEGKGTPQNFAVAYVWFNLSAASGNEEAAANRNQYASMLSRDELADAQRLSMHLFEEIEQRKAELLVKEAGQH